MPEKQDPSATQVIPVTNREVTPPHQFGDYLSEDEKARVIEKTGRKAAGDGRGPGK